jgi:hypothetical protein
MLILVQLVDDRENLLDQLRRETQRRLVEQNHLAET